MLPLKDEAILKAFDYSLGFLQWKNGEIDISPEAILEAGTIIEPAISA